MRDNIIVLELDKYEINMLINALNEFRNNLLDKGVDTEAINEILLKVIDAPEKKMPLLRVKKNEYER